MGETFRLQSDVLDALLWLETHDEVAHFDVWSVPTLFEPRVALGGGRVCFASDSVLNDERYHVPNHAAWGLRGTQLSRETLARHWRALAVELKLAHLNRRLGPALGIFEAGWIRQGLSAWMERLASQGRSRTRTWKALCDEVSTRLRYPESDRDTALIAALFSHDQAARDVLETLRVRHLTRNLRPNLRLTLSPITWQRPPSSQEVA